VAKFREVDEQRPSDTGPDAGHGLEQLGEFPRSESSSNAFSIFRSSSRMC
jgi:hypothetical protein